MQDKIIKKFKDLNFWKGFFKDAFIVSFFCSIIFAGSFGISQDFYSYMFYFSLFAVSVFLAFPFAFLWNFTRERLNDTSK